jgi:hypothetical protein
MFKYLNLACLINRTAIMFMIVVLFVSCRTIETTDNSNNNDSGLHAPNLEILIEKIMNNPDMPEFAKKSIIDQIRSGNFSNGDSMVVSFNFSSDDINIKDFLYVFPNPTSSDAVVTINPNFTVIDEGVGVVIPIDLYYMGVKIETLELPVSENFKFVIPSNYLQKEGSYTVVISGTKFSASFVVKK